MTIFATIAALALLYGMSILIVRLNKTFGTGTWRGTELEVKDDGVREEHKWKRKTWRATSSSYFLRRGPSSTKSEQEQITERSRLLG